MLAAVEDRPCDLARVLALQEEGFGFGRGEAEYLDRVELSTSSECAAHHGRTYFAVAADIEPSATGINPPVRERVDFGLHLHVGNTRLVNIPLHPRQQPAIHPQPSTYPPSPRLHSTA